MVYEDEWDFVASTVGECSIVYSEVRTCMMLDVHLPVSESEWENWRQMIEV